MSTEAMKLALEALGLYARTLAPTETQKKGMEAITALDEALAQPQQKPVADVRLYEYSGAKNGAFFEAVLREGARVSDGDKLYTSPPAQEFVCSTGLCHYSKPLTDEEIETVWRSVQANDFHDCVKPFARAIEAAHGIKENA